MRGVAGIKSILWILAILSGGGVYGVMGPQLCLDQEYPSTLGSCGEIKNMLPLIIGFLSSMSQTQIHSTLKQDDTTIKILHTSKCLLFFGILQFYRRKTSDKSPVNVRCI